MREKRAHERLRIRLPVVLVHAGEQRPAHTADVGLGGVFVHTELRLGIGTELDVQVTFPALKEARTLRASVRWSSPEGMGLQWTTALRAQEVWAIHQLRGQPDQGR